jgi:MOSC domain-containing protein YiiM
MTHGHIIGIYITSTGGSPLHAVASANALAGQGLEGDRYFNGAGTFTKTRKHSPDTEITLIESEALAALESEYGIKLDPSHSRRNLLTRGIALNHLVNREFSIGDARLRGIKLCEPCGHLEKLTQDGVKKGLIHRGGLRAQILVGGTVRAGEAITVHQSEPALSCA